MTRKISSCKRFEFKPQQFSLSVAAGWIIATDKTIYNDDNNNKKRRLDRDGAINTAAFISSASPVNTTNIFIVLDSIEDPMDVIEATTNQTPTEEPAPPPIFLDDIIDIQTMTNSLEKVINRKEYKLKILTTT